MTLHPTISTQARTGRRGSVLVLVLWVALGLVSITLYFAHSMTFELRTSDNRVAALEAEHAIEGVARYVSVVLSNAMNVDPGSPPQLTAYQREAVPIGDATFWLIGRGDVQQNTDVPYFSLADECSKLNLNTATLEMLQSLPRMTPELAAAIIDWRDSDSEPEQNGAESDTYERLQPGYSCKNAPFESVDELRLVNGMTTEILYGEDSNLNGVLDLNENDGPTSLPYDNRDGRVEPGLLEYVTVYTYVPNTLTNVNSQTNLQALLEAKFGQDRANEIMQRAGQDSFTSVLQFYIRSQMTMDEFTQIEGSITATNTELVNVNSASEAVLACIPGIGPENAAAVVSYRRSNANSLSTVAWMKDALPEENAIQAGPYITGRTRQYMADVAAVGHYHRGYRRVRFVFDTSEGAPRIVHRQDLGHLGWALGLTVRQTLLTQNTRR